jgi:cell division transport system permease protein
MSRSIIFAPMRNRRKLRPKPNYISSIISVSLVLFLLGLFALFSTHSTELADYFKERINIIVEFKPGVDQNKITTVMGEIGKREEIKKGSLRFISRDSAMVLLKEDFGEDFLIMDMPNPLFDVILFNVNGEALNKGTLFSLREFIKRTQPSVQDVYYQETMVDSIIENVEKIGLGVLIFSILLGLIAIALIHNAIKLALYSNRMLIRNMELVGASWSFIQRPFLLRSLGHGSISGLFAALLVAALVYLAVERYPSILEVLNFEIVGLILAGVFLSGIILTFMSTFWIVNKYLRVQLDELF